MSQQSKPTTYYITAQGAILDHNGEPFQNPNTPWEDSVYGVTPGYSHVLQTAESHAKGLVRELYDFHQCASLFKEGDTLLIHDELGDENKKVFLLLTVTQTQVLIKDYDYRLNLEDFDLVIR